MNQTIHLTMSSNNVSHWGFWRAISEILQNAIDTGFCDVCYPGNEVMTVKSKGGNLSLQSLMTGESTKRDDPDSIGNYGEGYKNALVILIRLGYIVNIKNGFDHWSFTVEPHPQLNGDCLAINIDYGFYSENDNEVTYIIKGVTNENRNEIEECYISSEDFKEQLDIKAEYNGSACFEPWSTPKLFVGKVSTGALYICDLQDGYENSYCFEPCNIDLTRDRSSVSSFYASYEATKVILKSGNAELLTQLSNDGASDISDEYKMVTEHHGCYSSEKTKPKLSKEISDLALIGFYEKHGKKAFPIRKSITQDKINILTKNAVSMGLTPIMISPALADMLPIEVRRLAAPKEIGKISEELELFVKANNKQLTSLGKKRLNLIIEAVKLNGN